MLQLFSIPLFYIESCPRSAPHNLIFVCVPWICITLLWARKMRKDGTFQEEPFHFATLFQYITKDRQDWKLYFCFFVSMESLIPYQKEIMQRICLYFLFMKTFLFENYPSFASVFQLNSHQQGMQRKCVFSFRKMYFL